MQAIRFTNLFSFASLMAYMIFIIYAPLLQIYVPGAKKILIFIALVFLPFTFFQPEFRSKLFFLKNKLLFFLTLYPIFILLLSVIFDTGGLSEISTFLSIYFVLAAITHTKAFFTFLKISVIINLYFLIYEFLNKSYLYEDFYNMSGELIRSIEVNSYGDVGFRAKGLFAGPLDASSFIIFTAIIFRNNSLLLYLCLASALIINGRLGIIITAILIFTRYDLSLKTIFYASVSSILALFFIINFQEDDAILNLLSVFDITSVSNTARIIYILAGIDHLLNVNFFGLLLGSSSAFLEFTNGHSAESGLVSMIIVHGFVGFFYLMVILFGFSNNLKRSVLVIVLIFLCLTIYRFDSGFMRSFFLYYILIYASMESFYDSNS